MFLINGIKGIIKFIFFILIFAVIIGVAISLIFPLDHRDEITRYSEIYDLDPFLVAAVIKVESGYKKDAESSKDAKGLMQIGPSTGQWAADELVVNNYSEEMLFDPQINIRFGSWYLRQLKGEFNDDLNLVLAAYNAGSGNVSNWLSDERYSTDGKNLTHIPFEETRNYLDKVKFNHKAYGLIYRNFMFTPSSESPLYFDLVVTISEYLSKVYNSLN